MESIPCRGRAAKVSVIVCCLIISEGRYICLSRENQQKREAIKDRTTKDRTTKDRTTGGGDAADRSGKGGKSGGGMGGQDAGGIKGGGKRKTHVGDKKDSPGGLTSD